MARRSAFATQPRADSQCNSSNMDVDESQQMSALRSLLQMPKTNHRELKSFDAKRAIDQGDLEHLLEHRMRQAEETSMHRRNELTKAIIGALKTPNRPMSGTPPTLGNTQIARNAVFKSLGHALKASDHLISEFDRLDKLIADVQNAAPGGVAEAWAQDIEKTAEVLRTGAGIAIKKVKKVLGADVEVDEVEDNRETNERKDAVEDAELNYELLQSLCLAERGVKKMVKSLQQDE